MHEWMSWSEAHPISSQFSPLLGASTSPPWLVTEGPGSPLLEAGTSSLLAPTPWLVTAGPGSKPCGNIECYLNAK